MTAPLRPSTSGVAALRPTTSGVWSGGSLAPRRNVIVFLIDDAGKEYFSAYDNDTWTGTPISSEFSNQWASGTFPYPPQAEIDELAGTGLLLTRMNVAAMCSPTRASLLTGRHNRQHTLGNAIQSNAAFEDDGTPFAYVGETIYQQMEEQGSPYERIHLGKWHINEVTDVAETQEDAERIMGNPVNTGRATYFEGHAGNWGDLPGFGNVSNHEVYTWCRHDARETPVLISADSSGYYAGQGNVLFDIFDGTGTHSLVRTVQAAQNAIQKARIDGKPFLLNVWLHAVHTGVAWSGNNSMGGAALSGYHSYGTSPPGGAPEASVASNVKAFFESVNTAIRLIRDSMSAAQRANTNIVVLSDNGSTSDMLAPDPLSDILEPAKPVVPAAPDNPYSPSHSKRSPWQGGIGAACIINGPDVVNPGDGTAPRVWDGLCGVEDLYSLIRHWTGTAASGAPRYDTTVLRDAVADASATGRTTYLQRAFQNGYSDDPFSDDQGNSVRFLSAQNADNWKLIWVSTGGGSFPGLSWKLYNMTNNPLEEDTPDGGVPHNGDVFDQSSGGTIQAKYDNLNGVEAGAKAAFAQLYAQFDAEGLIPDGLEVDL